MLILPDSGSSDSPLILFKYDTNIEDFIKLTRVPTAPFTCFKSATLYFLKITLKIIKEILSKRKKSI